MGEAPPEVFVAVYEDASRAAGVERELTAREATGTIALLAAAVIARDPGGEARWEIRGPGIGHLCSRADTIAAMLDVLLPAPVLVAALTATTDEGPSCAEAEREFGERFIREVAQGVEPGSSVFIGVIEDRWVPELERGLRGYRRLTSRRSSP